MKTFGRRMLDEWLLDPVLTYLNHGTVGATPRRVLAKQQALRDEMERQPSRFMLRELNGEMPAPWRTMSRLREASDRVAAFLGARGDDLVFVPNVTYGLNAVINSVPLTTGDEVVMTDLAYGAIARTAAAACADRGATLRTIRIDYPVRDSGDVVGTVASALTDRTRLVVIDHVTAQTALVLPVKDIAEACHAHGVPVVADGAHAPGSRVVDIPSLGVDWYSANLHKWAYAPRGCGILWAAPERQDGLRAPIVSWGRDRGFRHEFEHVATGDPTTFLAAPEGIALLQEWDFEAAVRYMHDLAWEASQLLSERWRVKYDVPRAMTGAMATIPLPASAGTTDDDAARLRLALLVEDQIEVQLHAWRNRLWVRVSAQVYNDRQDIERLAEAVEERTL